MGPFETLRTSLEKAEALRGWARVLLGRKKLPFSGAPRRVVLVPITGTLKAPADKRSLTDETPVIAAHLWGLDIDDVQDLTTRFFQALQQQADGDAVNGGGFFWKYDPGTIEWDTTADSSVQGEVKVVQFSIVLPLVRETRGTGTVEAVRITGTPSVGNIDIP